MKYNGVELSFDNFRSVLKDFSVDVQDVVRSALLDNVSLEKYIDTCKNNPYKLDQIRLGLKEGIDKAYFSYSSGEVIRGIRGLLKKGVNMSPLKKYKYSNISDKGLLYLIVWCRDGCDVSKLNISIIPDYLLDFFNYGIRKGVDMSVFNNGRQYSLTFTQSCLNIIECGCDVKKFSKGDWGSEVLEKFVTYANFNKKMYNALYAVVEVGISVERVSLYERAFAVGLPLKEIVRIEDKGIVVPDEVLNVVVEAYSHKIDLLPLLESGASLEELTEKYNEGILEGSRKLSGKFRRG